MAASPVRKCGAGCVLLVWVPRLLVAAIFLYTGVTKIGDLDRFVKEIRVYEILPVYLSNAAAYVLPWVEVLTAALLLIGLWRREARLLLVIMLVVFATAKTYVLAIGRPMESCGCMPTGSFLYFLFKGWMGVVTNVVLIALLVVEALATRRCRKVAPVAEAPADAAAPGPESTG